MNFLQIRGQGDGVWFVSALFIAFIPFYFFIHFYEKSKHPYKTLILIVISFILSLVSFCFTKYFDPYFFPWKSSVLPWHLEYIFQANFFMILGYLFKTCDVDFHISIFYSSWLFPLSFILYLCIAYIPYYTGYEFNDVVFIVQKYTKSILGCLVIIGVAKRIPTNKYISFVGSNTLIYFAIHGKCYALLQNVTNHFFYSQYHIILNNEMYSSIFAIILTIIISFILIIPSLIINKYFYFIIGREKSAKGKIKVFQHE